MLVKDAGRTLLQRHHAVALAFGQGYDCIKYNFTTPLSEAKFETHKHKWQYIELAKALDENKDPEGLGLNDLHCFCMFMYGEGYREPNPTEVNWILDIRGQQGLWLMYKGWKKEEDHRYELLEENLGRMKYNHHIFTFDEFKDFITPVSVGDGFIDVPQMWNTIGHSPENRANRTYCLTLQSFFLLDSAIHLLDRWDKLLIGEPEWDNKAMRLRTYRKLYSHLYPINGMAVRRVVNSVMKLK